MTLSIPVASREVERFLRYTLVGSSTTLLDMVMVIVLKEVIGLPLLLANTLSYIFSTTSCFTFNSRWTFSAAQQKQVWSRLLQFFVVCTTGLLLNNAIVLLLNDPIGQLINQPENGYIIAKMVAAVLIGFWNFTVNRYWTFNDVSVGVDAL